MIGHRRHPTNLKRICALGAVVLGVGLGTAPANAGAVGWVASGALTPGGRVAREPVTAETANGTRVLAWEQDGTTSTGPGSVNVRVAPPGADFGPTQTLVDDSATQLSLSVGSDGTVALVWRDFPARVGTVRIARLAPGARDFVFTPGISAGGIVGSDLQTAVADGNIFVAYQLFANQTATSVTSIDAVRLPAGTTTTQRIPGATSPDVERATFTSPAPPVVDVNPTIATDGANVFLAWELDADGGAGAQSSKTELHLAQYPVAAPPGATFSAPVLETTVTTPGTRAFTIVPQLSSAAGHVNVVWLQSDTGPLNDREIGAGPGAPTRSIASGGVDRFRASLAGDGTMIVAWERFDSPHGVDGVSASAVLPNGTPTAPVRISPVNASRILAGLVTAADGRALIITNRTDSDGGDANDVQVQAAFRPAGGAFGPLEEVSGAQDHSPAASLDSVSGTFGPQGEARIAWSAVVPGAMPGDEIFLSSRDALPPTISAVSVPSQASTGVTTRLSARATDTQSPVSVGWQFGDGSSATGASVTHIYGATGTDTVTVTARDSAGNTTTLTRAVTVHLGHDVTPPRIASLTLTNHRFRSGRAGTAEIARARRTPVGTTFHLRVDERSTIVIAVGQTVVRHHRLRTVSVGTLIRSGRGPGAVAIGFTGRVGTLRLRPGRYAATVTAVDGAGNRSRPANVAFQVVAR